MYVHVQYTFNSLVPVCFPNLVEVLVWFVMWYYD